MWKHSEPPHGQSIQICSWFYFLSLTSAIRHGWGPVVGWVLHHYHHHHYCATTTQYTRRCCLQPGICTTALASLPNRGVSGCSGLEVAVPLPLGMWHQECSCLILPMQLRVKAAVPSCLLLSSPPTVSPAPDSSRGHVWRRGMDGW